MKKTLGVFAFLFAVSTLVSQTAMDVFASLFVVGALILFYQDSAYRELVFRKFGWEKIVLALLGLVGLGLWFAGDLVPVISWSKLFDFRWILLAWLLGNFLQLYPPNRQHLIAFAWIFSVASGYALLIPILGFDPIDPGRALDRFPDGTIRTGGFLQQPIVFAQLYGLWVSFFLGFFVVQVPAFEELKSDRKLYIPLAVAAFLGLMALLLSFTRGIWVALPLSMIMVILFRRWTWAVALIVLGAVATVGLSFLWPAFESRILHALQGGEGERIWIWKANLQMFYDHPWLGTGYSHNVQLLPEYFERVGAPEGLLQSHAHNQFLHILVGTGLAGFFAYLCFWMFLLQKSYQTFKQHLSVFSSSIAMGVFAAYLTFQFGGLFESNFEHSKIRYTLAVLTALLIWLEFPKNNSSQAFPPRGKS